MADKQTLGVSLTDLKINKPKTSEARTSTHKSEIVAYQHDVVRSLVVGCGAIVIELVIYFSHILK